MKKTGIEQGKWPGFGLLFLASLYGLLLFRIFLAFWSPAFRSKGQDYFLYILGWSVFPAVGSLAAVLVRRVTVRMRIGVPLDNLAALNALLAFWAFLPQAWPAQDGPLLLGIFLALQFLWFVRAAREGPRPSGTGGGTTWGEFAYPALTLIFFGWVTALTHWPSYFRDLPPWGPFAGPVLFAAVWWGLKTGSPAPARKPWVLPLAVLLILVLVVDPLFRYDPENFNCYLAPLADLRLGKSLLVDANSQYGVLVIHFLRSLFLFLPMGYVSLALIATLLAVGQYALFFHICRKVFRSEGAAFLGLGLLILIEHFGSQIYFQEIHLNTGPLRFGFIYGLAALVLAHCEHPRWERPLRVLEAGVAGMAVFWSLEVCLCTVLPYLLFLLSEHWEGGRGGRSDPASLGKRLGAFGAWTAFFGAFIYGDVWSRAHELPHWGRYFEYFFLYQAGLESRPLTAFGAWWLVAGILYFSLFGCVGRLLSPEKGEGRDAGHRIARLLTFYGIAQFSYFLYKGHWTLLFNIAMPSLFLGIHWLRSWKAAGGVPLALRKAGPLLAAFFLALYLPGILPIAQKALQRRALPVPECLSRLVSAFRDRPREDDFARQAGELMGKYSGGKDRLPYFFGDKGVEVSLYAGRGKVHPYNDIFQADVCPGTRERILSFDPGWKAGDPVYLSTETYLFLHYLRTDKDLLRKVRLNVEEEILLDLASRYRLEPVERSKDVFVLRLAERRPARPVRGAGAGSP